MKESTQRIIDLMSSGTPTAEFTRLVSRKQLEECLIDESMDAEDLEACKNMLESLFNYKREIN